MSLSTFLLALFFLLLAFTQLGILGVTNVVMGFLALIIAIVLVVEAWHPIHFGRR